ncbi:ATP-binding cassette domain-containing protein [Winogradskyella poriferorum]|uniref:ATP-binding cassette domain-containing protein n=1 Tax=Winogradskyella poriferorum TaxID=307627 RepID=UPI003D65131E
MKFELDNVELYFREKRILNGIYLKAETGKVTAILGSNGCGKSCIMNIAFGILKPKYKLVRIDGKPLLKQLYKTNLARLLPQYNFVPNNMTLNRAFHLYDINWDHFASTFEAYRDFKSFKFKNLSGGQRRLIEIYIILKSNCELVLLDEPFSHLSPKHVESVKALISEEKHKKAILITDHMYRHIIETADSIYLLKNGCTKLINDLLELEDYKYLSEGSLSN